MGNTIIDLDTRKELFTCIHMKTLLEKMNSYPSLRVNRAQLAKWIPSHPHTRQRECMGVLRNSNIGHLFTLSANIDCRRRPPCLLREYCLSKKTRDWRHRLLRLSARLAPKATPSYYQSCFSFPEVVRNKEGQFMVTSAKIVFPARQRYESLKREA